MSVFKKYAVLLLACLQVLALAAQEKIQPTESFLIRGDLQKEWLVDIPAILSMGEEPLPDLVITNHLGAPKSTYRGLKGVSLKKLLEKLTLDTTDPKLFSTYYFVLEASDGYKVVYSWNELFNTPVGEKIFLVTAKDGKTIRSLDDRIQVISQADQRTGRRALKGLAFITVRKAA